MLFEKDKYYKYIQDLRAMVTIAYIVFTIIGFLFGGILAKGIGLLFGTGIGYFLGWLYSMNARIKIQDMYWKMDIHEKIKRDITRF